MAAGRRVVVYINGENLAETSGSFFDKIDITNYLKEFV